jgi:putative acetyltransferase
MTGEMTWRVERLDPASAGALRLFQLSDEYMAALYPAEANHMASAEDLQNPGAALYGCRAGAVLAACGAVKLQEGEARYGEIKRLFVDPPYRGRGLSKLLMARLEQHLLELGVELVRLEAGISQPEALGLYTRLGYVERGPFGIYTSNPYSIFFEKRLHPTNQSV